MNTSARSPTHLGSDSLLGAAVIRVSTFRFRSSTQRSPAPNRGFTRSNATALPTREMLTL